MELIQKAWTEYIEKTGQIPDTIILHPFTCDEILEKLTHSKPVNAVNVKIMSCNVYRSTDMQIGKFIITKNNENETI
jgi:hypothetical protein